MKCKYFSPAALLLPGLHLEKGFLACCNPSLTVNPVLWLEGVGGERAERLPVPYISCLPLHPALDLFLSRSTLLTSAMSN